MRGYYYYRHPGKLRHLWDRVHRLRVTDVAYALECEEAFCWRMRMR
jgi:hypothetical protein